MGFFSKFAFRPRALKMACENEPWYHKAKIVGFAILMSTIANYYQYYFQMLVYRSGQYQMAALAGDLQFLDYSYLSKWTTDTWSSKQTLDVWKKKSLKQLKQISMDWKTGSYEEAGTTIWTNPNGNPKDNKGYYKQSRKFYDSYKNKYNDEWDKYYGKNPIQRDADFYNWWADMHEGVMWFDTAACWQGKWIGQVNEVVIKPDASVNQQLEKNPTVTYPAVSTATDVDPSLDGKNQKGQTFGTFWEGWYTGATYSRGSPSKDSEQDPAYNKLVGLADTSGPYQRMWDATQRTLSSGQQVTVYQQNTTFRPDAWDVDIAITGAIGWNDKTLTTDLWDAFMNLADDCDMDCQKRGSQLTVIGSLMGAAYGVIALNALFMFIGAWRYRWRVCSVYCTFVACMLQLILTIVSGAMMFTKYNDVCARSMTNTFDGFRWTMHDDFAMTFNLWVASLILLLPFVCCGMCSAFETHT